MVRRLAIVVVTQYATCEEYVPEKCACQVPRPV